MKKRRGLLFVVMLLFCTLFLAQSASALESTCPPALAASVVPARGVTEVLVYSDVNRTTRLGKLTKGNACEVVGAVGDYYKMIFDGNIGYARKSNLTLKWMEAETAQSGQVVTDVALEQYIYRLPSVAKSMPIRGTIQTEKPLDTLFFFLWDERLQQMEHVLLKTVKNPAAQLDIRDVCRSIEFPTMTAGRKVLLIKGAADGEVMDIFQAPVYVCGAFKAVRNINDRCHFSAGRSPADMSGRSWTPSDTSKTLTITLPADGSAALMTIEWRFPVEAFTVVFLDAEKKTIAEETRTTGFYADAVEFPPETRQVQLSITGKDNWVRNLCVYDANHPDNAVQKWQPVPEKLDLMVFSPHQDDELLFFGGTIPYACHKGADVGLVYMTNCGRSRYSEALDGMWTAGLRTHPIFMNFPDQYGTYINNAIKTWGRDGRDAQKEVVRLFRQYKPEVIIGPDPAGEYGHAQHQLTTRLLSNAIALAMDESYDPESAEQYGVWEVKKVYFHLYGENQIEMDWTQPFAEGSPISPIFLAQEAFDKHTSQKKGYGMDRQGEMYDNKIFGLYYTTVGPDEAKNDIFEHIDLD